MATEIESYVRALAGVDPVGNWQGQGIASIERVGAGVFTITLDEAYEGGQVDGVINFANIDGGKAALTFSYIMLSETTIGVFFYDPAGVAADPGGFSFSLRIGNTELPLNNVL